MTKHEIDQLVSSAGTMYEIYKLFAARGRSFV